MAQESQEITAWDFDVAYDMCKSALTDYYQATGEGTKIDLELYIINDNLKGYTQKKIETQLGFIDDYSSRHKVEVVCGVAEAKILSDKNAYYIRIGAKIILDYGGEFAEPTEFLVQNLNGRLVIVDWYTSGSPTSPDIIRDGFQPIDNPDIWNDTDWVNAVMLKMK